MNEEMYLRLRSYASDEEIIKLQEEMEKPLPHKGFILNTIRIGAKEIEKEFVSLEKDKNIPQLYRYDPSKDSPGKTIFHEGGAFYILDPSAVEAVSNLEPLNKPHLVLDMCAAPGGKTITYAILNPDSLIIANDVSHKRAEELSSNIERLGLSNVIVTSLPEEEFLNYFPAAFDRIILDAPCSGTGMFRKEAKMEEDWSMKKVLSLLPTQAALLDTAYALLKKGGELIYLTCSFLSEEDEDQIRSFVTKHKDMKIMHPAKWKESYLEGNLKDTVHLFPSRFKGEGHFFTILRKDGEMPSVFDNYLPKKVRYDNKLKLYINEYNNDEYGTSLYLSFLPKLCPLRLGVKLTDHNNPYAKGRYDHALSHYLTSGLELNKAEALSYFRGEELRLSQYASYKDDEYAVSYCGLCLGFIMKKGNRFKNLLPKGLRKASLL